MSFGNFVIWLSSQLVSEMIFGYTPCVYAIDSHLSVAIVPAPSLSNRKYIVSVYLFSVVMCFSVSDVPQVAIPISYPPCLSAMTSKYHSTMIQLLCSLTPSLR